MCIFLVCSTQKTFYLINEMRGVNFILINNKNISPLLFLTPLPHPSSPTAWKLVLIKWISHNGTNLMDFWRFFKWPSCKLIKKTLPFQWSHHTSSLPFMAEETEMLYPRTIVLLWPESEMDPKFTWHLLSNC